MLTGFYIATGIALLAFWAWAATASREALARMESERALAEEAAMRESTDPVVQWRCAFSKHAAVADLQAMWERERSTFPWLYCATDAGLTSGIAPRAEAAGLRYALAAVEARGKADQVSAAAFSGYTREEACAAAAEYARKHSWCDTPLTYRIDSHYYGCQVGRIDDPESRAAREEQRIAALLEEVKQKEDNDRLIACAAARSRAAASNICARIERLS